MKKILAKIIVIVAILAGAWFFLDKEGAMKFWSGMVNWQGNGAGIGSGTADDHSDIANSVESGVGPEEIGKIAAYKYTETYNDPGGRFSFKYPAGFSVTEIPAATSEAFAIVNAATHVGAQIVVTPWKGDDIDMTPAVVASEIPDLQVNDPRQVTVIGATPTTPTAPARRGLAFTSDSPAFAGRSYEIWFVYGSNLYQLSSYAELRPFVDDVFAALRVSGSISP